MVRVPVIICLFVAALASFGSTAHAFSSCSVTTLYEVGEDNPWSQSWAIETCDGKEIAREYVGVTRRREMAQIVAQHVQRIIRDEGMKIISCSDKFFFLSK